jgi:predicted Fe-S protein YdhL (DUF1289 family)
MALGVEFCNSCGRLLTEVAAGSEDDMYNNVAKNIQSLKRDISQNVRQNLREERFPARFR